MQSDGGFFQVGADGLVSTLDGSTSGDSDHFWVCKVAGIYRVRNLLTNLGSPVRCFTVILTQAHVVPSASILHRTRVKRDRRKRLVRKGGLVIRWSVTVLRFHRFDFCSSSVVIV